MHSDTIEMDALKRKRVLNESLEESTKKFRNQWITCIEHLSNEIFYEIFDYFDGGEIVQTFSNLNSRFEQLLYSSSLLIKTHFYLFYYEDMINTDHQLAISSTKLCSNLKILSISSQNIIFLDAHRWEQFILHNYPQLEKFYFTYSDRMNNHNQYPIYSGRVNQFSSSFWIERKWIFNVKSDIDQDFLSKINCCISFRKTWYDNNIEYSTSTTLILTNFLTFSYNEILFEKIQRVLTITKIYHLIIAEKHSSMHVLIYLINLLPDLITFKLHSLLSNDRATFTVKELLTIGSIKIGSKIRKVYIGEINNIDDFDYLTLLCPGVKDFQVKRLNNMNIELFLRTILKLIYNNDICFIRSFCFHVPAANDQMMENLQQMIEYEQLLIQFTIKRVVDYIYLQWT